MSKKRKDKDKDWNPAHVPRRICTGWIVSTEYIQRALPFWRPELLSTDLARIVCGWCYDYFNKYGSAPGNEIEAIYEDHKATLDPDTAEEVEMLLQSLGEEYSRAVFNVEYLLDQTRRYFEEQHFLRTKEEVDARVERGEIDRAQAEMMQFTPAFTDKSSYIDPFSKDALPAFRSAFEVRKKPILTYGFTLGEFWNEELTRDAFVAFMAREKGGKSWLLMDLAIRGARKGSNVVFFQAGDMTENQFLRRLAIYMARRSDQERYCKDVWEPKMDCRENQQNVCRKSVREPSKYPSAVIQVADPTFEDLKAASADFRRHTPCTNCSELKGAVWLKKRPDVTPLTSVDVEREVQKFHRFIKGRLRVSTHSNQSLSVTHIKSLLNKWEREEGFVVDIVVIDYADILAPCPDFARLEFRHQQNRVWQKLRSLSQERHCLVVTATQAKATAYKKDLLDLSDYSEDKRKYAHVTAMFGLNQTPEEKRIGIMRINTLLVRDSDFDTDKPVHVLQRLQTGRPVMGSYLGTKYES